MKICISKSLPTILLTAITFLAAVVYDTETTEELRTRGGLPNFFDKATKGGDVRIAYFGGSITAANGWRVKTLEAFRKQFPKANIIEINAAVAGTGTDYAACRINDHVLKHKPDLIFVEFRVNGGNLPSAEGIVRQAWNANPLTDICFVYTINEGMVAPISSGNNPSFGIELEKVANHYQIPSIDFGIEVVNQLNDGLLVFKGANPPEGKFVFAKDGTHPENQGHEIYAAVVARSFESMANAGKVGAHTMPEVLTPNAWVSAKLAPLSSVAFSFDWSDANVTTDSVVKWGGARSVLMFPEAKTCKTVGESFTVKFRGTSIGVLDIPPTVSVILKVTVNGKEIEPLTRKETFRKEQSMGRFVFLPEMPQGEYTVTFEIATLPEGATYYLGPILVLGEVIK